MRSYLDQIKATYPDIVRYQNDADWGNEIRTLRDTGRMDDAIARSKQLILSQPRHHEGFEELAYCLEASGDIAQARYFMHEALARARRFLEDKSLDQEVMDELAQAFARLDPGTYRTMDIDALVDVQAQSAEWPDPALLRTVIDHGAAAVPALRRQLLADDEGLFESDFSAQQLATLYAIHGVEQAAEAIPDLVRYFGLIDEDWLDFLMHYLTVFGDRVVDPMLAVLQTEGLSIFQHGLGIDTCINAATSAEARTRVANFRYEYGARMLAPAAEGGMNDADDREFLAQSILGDLIELGDARAREFADRMMLQGDVEAAYVKKRFARGRHDYSRDFSGDWLDSYADNYVARVYDPKDDPLTGYTDDAKPKTDNFKNMLYRMRLQRSLEGRSESKPIAISNTPVHKAQKPGRNDPCWCGSGKKYKHCHLNVDA